jgi:hypothetical protein
VLRPIRLRHSAMEGVVRLQPSPTSIPRVDWEDTVTPLRRPNWVGRRVGLEGRIGGSTPNPLGPPAQDDAVRSRVVQAAQPGPPRHRGRDAIDHPEGATPEAPDQQE